MSNLLKEAIADAKAVRETALENAKAALEEAFTPRLQSMLSQKLKEDETEENEDEVSEEEVPEEDEEAEEIAMDELEDEEGGEEEEKPLDVDAGDSTEEPVAAVSDEVPAVDSDDDDDDDDDDEEDLDVEAIVKELEAEEDEEAEEGYDVDETETEEDEEVAETIEVNGQKYSLVKEEETEEDEVAEESVNEEEAEEDETVEEIVDLSELLDELEGETEEDEEVAEEVTKLQGDLNEHRQVIKYLKNKLNEVNLLNAKLLFTNKLFKTYNLNNNQKLRVVETFDRAKNTREIKLIYSTLAESFSGKTSGVKVGKINEAIASKPQKSTKPSKKVINEGSDIAARFKKLAGIN